MVRREEPERGPEVDLHGLGPADALRRLGQALHAARVRGSPRIRVVTGLGFGNRSGQPVLRTRVEEWLRGPDARRLGVRGFARVSRGGALDVRLS